MGLHVGVALKRIVRIFRRHRVVRPRVATGQRDLAIRQVGTTGDTEAGRATVELRRAALLLLRGEGIPVDGIPQIAPAGVMEHAIAFADRLHRCPVERLRSQLPQLESAIAELMDVTFEEADLDRKTRLAAVWPAPQILIHL